MKRLLCLAILAFPFSAQASDLRFNFDLPAFGGNGMNNSYYMTMLESQKRVFEEEEPEQTQLERFREDLERRLLTTLASDITQKIFGTDATPGGSFEIGDLSVSYTTDSNGDVIITLNDGNSTTEIVVPELTDAS
ncbi:MAG: curli assembly protein CsgF [Pseudomonadota bacterium]|nr:curli assembly protein CsgF [Pseudomonadota bacterium]MEE3070314.1 curli assembly protein CsgF [Pseudomonadota bacterium]